jgi:hypothetical protein
MKQGTRKFLLLQQEMHWYVEKVSKFIRKIKLSIQCVRLEKKLGDSQMFLEFEHIPRKKEGEACTCALNQENISKNRYVYALLKFKDN